MLDEFEIRLASKKNRMFPGDSLDKERRKAEIWFQFLSITFFALAGLLIYLLWKVTSGYEIY